MSGRNMVVVSLVLLLSGCSVFHPARTNQTDASGKKTGRWITYSTEAPIRKVSDGYFKDDREYRRYRYYHPNGKRQVRFVYGRHHEFGKSHIRVKYWYPSGKVMQKGTSLMFIDEREVRYVYDGLWRFYDEKGRLTERTRYRMGEPVDVEFMSQADSIARTPAQ